MILSRDDILLILELLSRETVVPSSVEFPYLISRKSQGYSADPKIGGLQAKLSIMLEMTKH